MTQDDWDWYDDGWMYCEKCGEGFIVYYKTFNDKKRTNGADDEGNVYCQECFKELAVIHNG